MLRPLSGEMQTLINGAFEGVLPSDIIGAADRPLFERATAWRTPGASNCVRISPER